MTWGTWAENWDIESEYIAAGLLASIQCGDRVTIITPQGNKLSGRAVMRGPHGWVLNLRWTPWYARCGHNGQYLQRDEREVMRDILEQVNRAIDALASIEPTTDAQAWMISEVTLSLIRAREILQAMAADE
jgi:hypothetical protein